jgi:hypothetical protein
MKQITQSHIDRPFFASRALRHNTKQALQAIKTIQRKYLTTEETESTEDL